MENDETLPPLPGEALPEIKEYLKVLREIPPLTFDQEQELVRRIAREDQHARTKLIKANLRLVVAIGKKYMNQGLNFSTIIEKGQIGLRRAIDKYKNEYRYKFSTYAAWWIKHAIESAIDNQKTKNAGYLDYDGESTFNGLLEVDRFVEGICIVCDFKGIIFPLPYIFFACPKCLNDRIKDLRQVEYIVPEWILYLEKDSEFRKNEQTMVKEGHVFFHECAICKKAIMPDNARYYFPPGVHTSKSYCIECYERLTRGEK